MGLEPEDLKEGDVLLFRPSKGGNEYAAICVRDGARLRAVGAFASMCTLRVRKVEKELSSREWTSVEALRFSATEGQLAALSASTAADSCLASGDPSSYVLKALRGADIVDVDSLAALRETPHFFVGRMGAKGSSLSCIFASLFGVVLLVALRTACRQRSEQHVPLRRDAA